MKIQFYLLEDDGTEKECIATLANLTASPFKIGDVLAIDVRSLRGKDLDTMPKRMQQIFEEKNHNLTELLHLKKIKIVRDFVGLTLSLLNESQLNIEYFCKIVEE